MGPIIWEACEVPDAMKYMSNPRVCNRCGSCTVDVPPSEVAITTGEAWAVNTRRLTLCHGCNEDLEAFLLSPPRWAQLEPDGAGLVQYRGVSESTRG